MKFTYYTCKYCSYMTGSRREIRRHIQEVHKVKGHRYISRHKGESLITRAYKALKGA